MSDSPRSPLSPPRAAVGMGVAVFLLGIALAAVGHRVFERTARSYPWDSEQAQKYELLAALPEVADGTTPRGLLLGSSVLQRVDPQLLDEELARHGLSLTTYNLSLPAAGPTKLLLLAERMERELAVHHRRVALTVLDVPVNQMTWAAQRSAFERPEQYVPLYDVASLVALLPQHPVRAGDVLYRHFVLGDADLGALATWVLAKIGDRDWPCRFERPAPLPPDLLAQAVRYCSALDARSPGGLAPAWGREARGFLRVPADIESLYAWRRRPPGEQREHVDEHVLRLARTLDVLDVGVDERQVEVELRLIETVRRFSDHVVLLFPPQHPRLRRTPEGEARVGEVLGRLSARAPLVDLRFDPRFDDDDFEDALHIDWPDPHSGKLTRAAAAGIARALALP